jgi:hypothetical protein
MSDVKNVSVAKEGDVMYPEYLPTEKEVAVIGSVFNKFRNSADERNYGFEYFDGLTLQEYIEDSVKRFYTNIDEREGLEDWQARIHDPFTRNKVLAILGKVVQVLPIAKIESRGDEDLRKAIILNNLYEYAEEIDDYEELMINILLECIVKGTSIGYEGLEVKTKDVKNIKKYDDKLTYEVTRETRQRLFGAIVPLEDFYPSSVSIRRIKDMPYCFWRSTIPFQKFLMDYGMYEDSKFVQPKSTYTGLQDDKPFYVDFISNDIREGAVEIIRYYNKDVDEYVIIANGVWLNPINTGESLEISPLPFNHKDLPFWEIKFDLFGADFFYGKSLPDRLKSMQDVLNVLSNMLLDQSFLTIFPPLLTNGFDSIEDDYLRPGRRTPIDTQGLPITSAFMKLDLGVPSGWHQYILEYTRKIMEQSSLDQVSSGQAGVGGRTTAQEIRQAAEGVQAMLGLLGKFVNYGLKRKATLKSQNVLQFWTDKDNPMIRKVRGDGANQEFNDAFNIVKLDNTVLSSGKRGTKIIEMYGSPDKKPTAQKLKARSKVNKAVSGRDVEIIAVDPEYIRDLAYDIKIVPNPRSEASKDIDKALQLEKTRVYLSFFPEMVNKRELAAQTAEKMGDDPTKILNDEVFNPAPKENNPELRQPMSAEPEGNVAENMMRGAKGGEMNSMQLRDLQNSMLG